MDKLWDSLILLGSLAAHELAHALVAEWLGCPVKSVVWRWLPLPGVGIKHIQGTQEQNLVIAAAGPAMTLFLFWALWPFSPMASMGNLALFLQCILTYGSSDGMRMLRAWENIRCGYVPFTRRG